jgi:hypothetical protein
MKRLKLDVADLQVESFAVTRPPSGSRGTVHGNAMATNGCTVGYVGCDPDPIEDTRQDFCIITQETQCEFTCVDWTCAAYDDCLHISAQGYFTCGFWSCDGACP